MKTPKPIVVKSVSGAVAASILVSSCLPGYDFDDSYYGPHADNLTHGESFFELSESNLSEEFFHKLKAIQQIVETVLIDKKRRDNSQITLLSMLRPKKYTLMWCFMKLNVDCCLRLLMTIS